MSPKRQEQRWVGRRVGEYRLVQGIGVGGMGAVFEGVHERLGRRAAIKILHPHLSQDPELAARFLNEARAANRVRHSSIVDIHEVNQLPDGALYMVMEYLDGEVLSARLRRVGVLGDAAIRPARQIAAALAAAHAKGIIHRDLKPGNVMLVPDPESPGGERAKVLDFGIAKLSMDDDDRDWGEVAAVRTRTGMILGTPLYMAPEQCRGAGGVTSKADVYALGIMLYQMLSGSLPFTGSGAGEIFVLHLSAPPRPLRELAPAVSATLVTLVHSLLSKDPADRPTMSEVAAALEQLDSDLATRPLRVGGSTASPARPPRGSRLLVATSAGVAAALVALVWSLLVQRHPEALHREPLTPAAHATQHPWILPVDPGLPVVELGAWEVDMGTDPEPAPGKKVKRDRRASRGDAACRGTGAEACDRTQKLGEAKREESYWRNVSTIK